MTSKIECKDKPECDFINYCGDKADTQIKIGSEIKNVCYYHAQEEFDDTDPEDVEIDDSLKDFNQ